MDLSWTTIVRLAAPMLGASSFPPPLLLAQKCGQPARISWVPSLWEQRPLSDLGLHSLSEASPPGDFIPPACMVLSEPWPQPPSS